MARIIVQGPHDARAEIFTTDEGEALFECACGVQDTDRGHMADTLQAAEIHVDSRCEYRYPKGH